MLSNLPLVIGNSVTQFCDDKDNSKFISCCKIIKKYAIELPRESEFVVNTKSDNMYKNYRNIHLVLKGNFYPNIPIIKLNKLNEKIIQIKISSINSYRLLSCLDKLQIFKNVHTLNIEEIIYGDILLKFPNTRKLITSDCFHSMDNYSDMPNLVHLISTSTTSNVYLPNNWTNIEILETHNPVPETYTKLTHLKTQFILAVPEDIAKNIKHLEIERILSPNGESIYNDMITVNDVIVLNLKRFHNLQKLEISEYLIHREILIIGDCKEIILHGKIKRIFRD